VVVTIENVTNSPRSLDSYSFSFLTEGLFQESQPARLSRGKLSDEVIYAGEVRKYALETSCKPDCFAVLKKGERMPTDAERKAEELPRLTLLQDVRFRTSY